MRRTEREKKMSRSDANSNITEQEKVALSSVSTRTHKMFIGMKRVHIYVDIRM